MRKTTTMTKTYVEGGRTSKLYRLTPFCALLYDKIKKRTRKILDDDTALIANKYLLVYLDLHAHVRIREEFFEHASLRYVFLSRDGIGSPFRPFLMCFHRSGLAHIFRSLWFSKHFSYIYIYRIPSLPLLLLLPPFPRKRVLYNFGFYAVGTIVVPGLCN